MFHFKSNRHPERHQGRRHSRGDGWPGSDHPLHGRGFGHRGGGRLGRLFAHGDLHFVILHLIAEQPRHGYDIIKAIEEKVGGSYSPSPGTVYPALTMLEEQGYVSVAQAEGSKKLYAMTEAGRAYLDANRAAVTALLLRMQQTHASHGGGPAPQIVRAVENVKLALKLRLSRAPLTEDQIRIVTEVLDRAARDIEGS